MEFYNTLWQPFILLYIYIYSTVYLHIYIYSTVYPPILYLFFVWDPPWLLRFPLELDPLLLYIPHMWWMTLFLLLRSQICNLCNIHVSSPVSRAVSLRSIRSSPWLHLATHQSLYGMPVSSNVLLPRPLLIHARKMIVWMAHFLLHRLVVDSIGW